MSNYCICCNKPAQSIAAFVLDARGDSCLGIGMCSHCVETNGGNYSDEVSAAIHARYLEHPEKYLAEPFPAGRLH